MEDGLRGYGEIKFNVLDSVDSGIRKGFGTETFILLYELLDSLSCPELNLINNWINNNLIKDEKLGVGGKV